MTNRLPRIFLLALLIHPAATRGAEESVSFGGLLAGMLDRAAIAEFPEPGFACKQASSYNPVSKDPTQPEWFSTDDYSQFVRVEEVDGRREWVMMDVDGPGAIVRWWITQYKFDGTIRVYLDGSDQPALEGKGDQLIGGKPGGPVGPPLAAMRSRGCNLYLPIPFAKHCKVTYDGKNARETRKFGDNIYYNINYVQYPKGTDVKTFTKAGLKTNAELLARVQRELIEPGNNALPIARTVEGGRKTLAPGEFLSRDVSGGGAIGRLRVKISADDLRQALRSTVLIANFDGRQRVWAPLGGFFGTGPGLNPFQGWWRRVEDDGWMTCWWPMPFRETAAVVIRNHGTAPVTVELAGIGVADWEWTDRSLYFNSTWRGENHISVFGNDFLKGEEWNYLTVGGKGVYAGDTMVVFNRPWPGPKGNWWGEGDEKIHVDGESFPSHFGTGTEDYFGYAWGTSERFSGPFHAQPESGANHRFGQTVNTRTRMLDRIPFNKSLKFNMELMHWKMDASIDYATTTYWYGTDRTTGNGQTSPERVRRRVGEIDEEKRNRSKHGPGLFNGRSLHGWEHFLVKPDLKMADVWSVRDGILVCKGEPMGYLYTREKFKDFRLVVEYRWAPGGKPGNSGILLRIAGEPRALPKCAEVQLRHGKAGDVYGFHGFNVAGDEARAVSAEGEVTGKLTGVSKIKGAEKAPGEWNTFEITLQGGDLTAVLNGEKVNQARGLDTVAGPIGLQSEGGEIQFRTVRLAPVPKEGDKNR